MKVCFVALYALPIFDAEVRTPFGGLETRAATLARGLARRPDFDVAFVVQHHQPLRSSVVDDLTLHRLPLSSLDRVRRSLSRRVRLTTRFPYLDILAWSPRLLWQIPLLAACRPFRRRWLDPRLPQPFFTELAADCFLAFGVNDTAATVIASAHASGRRAMLFLGSDADLDEPFAVGSGQRNPYGVRAEIGNFALREADAIVVQTPHQHRLLASRFRRDGDLVVNPFDFDRWHLSATPDVSLTGGLERYALWVGRTDTFHKRPLLLLDLARRVPDVDFLMVLDRTDPALARQIERECPANVRIIDPMPFGQMPSLFRGASLFVSTSDPAHEGFPNVFLQASGSRVPVATFEMDPGYLTAVEAGSCAEGSLDRLATTVSELWRQSELAQQQGENGFRHVLQNHSASDIATRLAEILVQLRLGSTFPSK